MSCSYDIIITSPIAIRLMSVLLEVEKGKAASMYYCPSCYKHRLSLKETFVRKNGSGVYKMAECWEVLSSGRNVTNW